MSKDIKEYKVKITKFDENKKIIGKLIIPDSKNDLVSYNQVLEIMNHFHDKGYELIKTKTLPNESFVLYLKNVNRKKDEEDIVKILVTKANVEKSFYDLSYNDVKESYTDQPFEGGVKEYQLIIRFFDENKKLRDVLELHKIIGRLLTKDEIVEEELKNKKLGYKLLDSKVLSDNHKIDTYKKKVERSKADKEIDPIEFVEFEIIKKISVDAVLTNITNFLFPTKKNPYQKGGKSMTKKKRNPSAQEHIKKLEQLYEKAIDSVVHSTVDESKLIKKAVDTNDVEVLAKLLDKSVGRAVKKFIAYKLAIITDFGSNEEEDHSVERAISKGVQLELFKKSNPDDVPEVNEEYLRKLADNLRKNGNLSDYDLDILDQIENCTSSADLMELAKQAQSSSVKNLAKLKSTYCFFKPNPDVDFDFDEINNMEIDEFLESNPSEYEHSVNEARFRKIAYDAVARLDANEKENKILIQADRAKNIDDLFTLISYSKLKAVKAYIAYLIARKMDSGMSKISVW